MRNLNVTWDGMVYTQGKDRPSSVCRDAASDHVYVLTEDGMLHSYVESENYARTSSNTRHVTQDLRAALEADEAEEAVSVDDDKWFYCEYLSERNVLALFTRQGFICSIADGPVLGKREFELEGAIEGGIAAAAWSPDQAILVLATNNNTLMAFTPGWEVIAEVDVAPCTAGSSAVISWAGDGEYVTVFSTDDVDGTARGMVRIYSKDLNLLATGRGIHDGPQSVLKDLQPALGFATAGNLVAVAQHVSRKPPRVCLLERNGLAHGYVELSLPRKLAAWVTDKDITFAADDVRIEGLFWNAASTLLAVHLVASSEPAVVFTQVYYRDNYHWYLKQVWEMSPGAVCLGFDAEQTGRLYISTKGIRQEPPPPSPPPPPSSSSSSSSSSASSSSSSWSWGVRVLDVAFATSASQSSDASVAVVDGSRICLTPVAKACMPPPMSLFQLESHAEIQGSIRHVSFWTPTARDSGGSPCPDYAWGLACLYDDSHGTVTSGPSIHLRLANAGGVIVSDHICLSTFPPAFRHRGLRPRAVHVHSSHDSTDDTKFGDITVFVLFNDGKESDQRGACGGDVIGVLVPRAGVDARRLPGELIMLSPSCTGICAPQDQATLYVADRITGFATWTGSDSAIAVGVIPSTANDFTSSPFQLHALNWRDCADGKRQYQFKLKLDLPEVFSSVAVIDGGTVGEAMDEEEEPVVVGLSTRNRLYCNDTLLLAGVSSFVWNTGLQTILYVSMGTRPHLHMVPQSRLLEFIKLGQGGDEEIGLAVEESVRPVERGARLVACSDGAAKTIIQLPRGNLESFEPRALILDRARHMLDQEPIPELYPCLIMLRKHKVDLNFIVDHDPDRLLLHWDVLLEAALPHHADYIALLLSGLRGYDTSAKKYFNRAAYERKLKRYGEAPFEGTTKVSAVCDTARDALLRHFDGRTTFETGPASYPAVLNPLLCTYACRDPPQLEEALGLVRRVAVDQGAGLESSWAQAAMKYLSFLTTHQALFDAAVGMCDFSAARVVARQCQMDPKVYLPLLSQFESSAGGDLGLGKEPEALSACQSFTRFAIHVHLQHWHEAAVWGARAFIQGSTEVTAAEVVDIIKREKQFSDMIPLVHDLTLGKGDQATSRELTRSLHRGYGQHCLQEHFYAEAASAFLACEPPETVLALEAAEKLGDWEYTMSIAARYFRGHEEWGPIPTAQRLVETFRGALMNNSDEPEEADFEREEDAEESGMHGSVLGDAPVGGRRGGDEESRPLQAARLAVEYLGDVETAIAILLTCKQYSAATNVALRANRLDLLEGDIAEALSRSTDALVALLESRVERQKLLVAELEVLWADGEARVKLIADTEPAVAEMERKKLLQETAERELGDCTGSDFSYVSRMSQQSFRSGTSTVSVLSNLSLVSSVTTASISEKSEFSVQGLQHSLLSRGKEDEWSGANGTESARERKKRLRDERKKSGRGRRPKGRRDPLGLKKEAETCRQLWHMSASIPSLVNVVTDVCDAYLVLGGKNAVSAVARLQAALTSYASGTQTYPPPMAPNYPPEWLQYFEMTPVVHYQKTPDEAGQTGDEQTGQKAAKQSKDWWEKTTEGLRVLTDNRRLLPI